MFQAYGAAQVTAATRSRPTSPGERSASATASASDMSSVVRIALSVPARRMWRVTARVSMPSMPMTPAASR